MIPVPGRRRASRGVAALLACLAAAPARAGAARLPAGARQVDLARHAEFLLDPAGGLGLAEVREPAVAARFRPLGGPRSLGFTSAALWLRVELVNEAPLPRRLVLVSEAPLLESLDVWLERDGRLERHRGGFAVPEAERDIALGLVRPVEPPPVLLHQHPARERRQPDCHNRERTFDFFWGWQAPDSQL